MNSKQIVVLSICSLLVLLIPLQLSKPVLAEEEQIYPILALDEPIEYFIPRNFSVVLTSFSSTPGILIRMDIYDHLENRSWQLNNYLREYFVNERLFFNASILQEEQEYEMIITAFDNLGRNKSISQLVEIDPVFPVILDVQIPENTLYFGGEIDISYSVEDDHFKAVYIYIGDDQWFITSNHKKQGTITLHDYFFWVPSGYSQYTFDCRLVACDWAGNNVTRSFTITYIDDRRAGLNEEELNSLLIKIGFISLPITASLLGLFIVVLFVSRNRRKRSFG